MLVARQDKPTRLTYLLRKEQKPLMTTIHQSGAEGKQPRTLAYAQTYAKAGARVLPLRPRAKIPALTEWPTQATTDPAQVAKWFGNGTAYNLGIAMGEWTHTATQGTYLVCIDLDRHPGQPDGVEAWQQLVQQHGEQGAPFVADTATGGLHLLYTTTTPLSKERGTLPPGIDVRGVGGQIMTEPSEHPDNGKSPHWRNTNWDTDTPGMLPDWVLQLIQAKPVHEPIPQFAKAVSHNDPTNPRPGDEYNNTKSWDIVLANDGWTVCDTKPGAVGYTRPGKVADKNAGPSAWLYPGEGAHGVLVVFSTNAPQQLLQPQFLTTTGGHYKLTSPWAYEVAMRHNGDWTQAAKTVGAEHRRDDERQLTALTTPQNLDTQTVLPEPDYGHTFVLQSLSALIGMPYEPIVPTVLTMDNGQSLFYPNAHNLVAGTSGIGKSWLNVVAIHQQIKLGHHAVVIDYEMNMHNWYNRLRGVGATDGELALVHYCQPDEALSMVLQYGQRATGKAHKVMTDQLLRIADMGKLALVCIDGVTNAMTANSLKLIDNTDVAIMWQLLPEHIVRLTQACVVLTDHVPKNSNNDTVLPIGGQHKVASTTGAAFIVGASSYMSAIPLHDGVLNLKLIKDRHGNVGTTGTTPAQVVLSPHAGGRIEYQVLPYTGGSGVSENSQQGAKVLQALADITAQGLRGTLNTVSNMSGVSNKTTLGTILNALKDAGRAGNYGTQSKQDWRLTPQDNVLSATAAELGLDF